MYLHTEFSTFCNNHIKRLCSYPIHVPSLSIFSTYMWQSQVKGGAHTCYINLSGIHTSSLHIRALPLTELWRYSASNVATQLNYTTEWCSISTRDCHMSLGVNCTFMYCVRKDRTKTRNRLGNGSKNGSICSTSGRGKCFHGRVLSAHVSVHVWFLPVKAIVKLFTVQYLVPLDWLRLICHCEERDQLAVYCLFACSAQLVAHGRRNFTIAYRQNHTKQLRNIAYRQKQKLKAC